MKSINYNYKITLETNAAALTQGGSWGAFENIQNGRWPQ